MHQAREYRSALILAAASPASACWPGAEFTGGEPDPGFRCISGMHNEDAAYQRYLMDEACRAATLPA